MNLCVRHRGVFRAGSTLMSGPKLATLGVRHVKGYMPPVLRPRSSEGSRPSATLWSQHHLRSVGCVCGPSDVSVAPSDVSVTACGPPDAYDTVCGLSDVSVTVCGPSDVSVTVCDPSDVSVAPSDVSVTACGPSGVLHTVCGPSDVYNTVCGHPRKPWTMSTCTYDSAGHHRHRQCCQSDPIDTRRKFGQISRKHARPSRHAPAHPEPTLACIIHTPVKPRHIPHTPTFTLRHIPRHLKCDPSPATQTHARAHLTPIPDTPIHTHPQTHPRYSPLSPIAPPRSTGPLGNDHRWHSKSTQTLFQMMSNDLSNPFK